MKSTYHWRRSADARPILYLDIVIETEEGWRLASFAAYEVLAHLAPELNR